MEQLTINENTSLKEVMSEFQKLFPFLKIEFFTKKHKINKESWSKFQIRVLDQKINEINPKVKTGIMYIRPQMTVSEFEQNFQDLFGFGVQVFRKSKTIWLETTETDDWILEFQNHTGKTQSTTESHMEFEI